MAKDVEAGASPATEAQSTFSRLLNNYGANSPYLKAHTQLAGQWINNVYYDGAVGGTSKTSAEIPAACEQANP